MDFKYRINNNNTVTIMNYIGNDKDVVIPSEIEGRKVVRIGDCAFLGCSSLTSITIPDSVTEIGYSAFACCTSLTSVNIPDSVSFIGYNAFYRCHNLTSVTISDSVTSIGGGVFDGCDQLVSKKSNYKAFVLRDDELWCRDYKFTPNEWSKEVETVILCNRGYHFCTNLFEIFNYYNGKLNKDIAIYECEIGGKVIESGTSKCVTNKIKPVRRLSREEIIDILNGKEV